MDKVITLKYRLLKNFLFSIVFCVCFFPAYAVGGMSRYVDPRPEELALLPEWCQIRMLAHPKMFHHADADKVPDAVMNENVKWMYYIGKDIYVYMHHYCRGLNWINRYRRTLDMVYENVEGDRSYALKSALGDFKFLESHVKPFHRIYPEMLMNQAYLFEQKIDYTSALNNYNKILKYRPEFAPVYIRYAELLDSLNKRGDAIEYLRLGLKRTAGDESIKKKLDEYFENDKENLTAESTE